MNRSTTPNILTRFASWFGVVLALTLVLATLPSAASARERGPSSTISDHEPLPDIGRADRGRSGPLQRATYPFTPSYSLGAIPLDLVAGTQPAPDPVAMLPPTPGGTLTGNAVGCASNCVTQAELTKDFMSPDLDLLVQTTVATSKALWVLPPVPFMINGVPAHAGHQPMASQGPSLAWSTDIEPLEWGTSYRLVLGVTDLYGNSRLLTSVITTSAEPAGGLAAPGSACYFDCITSGTVTPGPTHDIAILDIASDAPVTFDIAVSELEPVMVGGNPVLPMEVDMDVLHFTDSAMQAQLSGLDPETTYHVVATATDAGGFIHHAVGQFTSLAEAPDEVWIHFDRIHVHGTGDLIGRADAHFTYGFNEHFWYTDRLKLNAGDGVTFDRGSPVTLMPGEHLPDIIVDGHETDPGGITDLACPIGPSLFDEPVARGCNDTVAVASIKDRDVDWILTLPLCSEYGHTGTHAERRCHVVSSAGLGDEFMQFDALISFRVS